MALSIAVRTGMVVRIGGHPLEVRDASNPERIIVEIERKEIVLTLGETPHRMLPQVTLSCGKRKSVDPSGTARLTIEAPRDLRVESDS